MKNKIAVLSLSLIFISILIWLNFFRNYTRFEFEVDKSPIIAVDYFSKQNTTEGLKVEKAEKLYLASRIFSITNPEVESAEIVSSYGYGPFADYNVIIASEREQFFANSVIKNIGNNRSNYISEILDDNDNQKFASIYQNQPYEIFLELERFNYQPENIIINAVLYPIDCDESMICRVRNFRSQNITSVGIKPENDQYKVKEVIFVSGKIATNKNLIRSTSSADIFSHDDKKLIETRFSHGEFIFLKSRGGIGLKPLIAVENSPIQLTLNDYFYQKNIKNLAVDIYNNHQVLLISSDGHFEVFDLERKKLFAKNLSANVVIVFLGLLLFFKRLILKYAVWTFVQIRFFWEKVFGFIDKKNVEFVISGLIIVALLIFQTNKAVANYLTTTNLIVIMFVLILIIIRFSWQILVSIMLLFLVFEMILLKFNQIVVAEKAGVLIYSLLFILLVKIIFSKVLVRRKNNDNKKSKS